MISKLKAEEEKTAIWLFKRARFECGRRHQVTARWAHTHDLPARSPPRVLPQDKPAARAVGPVPGNPTCTAACRVLAVRGVHLHPCGQPCSHPHRRGRGHSVGRLGTRGHPAEASCFQTAAGGTRPSWCLLWTLCHSRKGRR